VRAGGRLHVNKPLWSLAGVALLASAGVGGAVIVASSGGEEEVTVQGTTTATPTEAATVSATPSAATKSPEPSPTSEAFPGPAVTYTNPVYGYSFDYPGNWFIHTDPGGYTIITSYDPATAKGIGGIGPGLKIDILVQDNPDRRSLEEWLIETDARRAGTGPVTVASESRVASPAPGITRETRTHDGPVWREYWFSVAGKVYSVAAVPADSTLLGSLKDLISTLRFKDE
jgi:hypothetical protein